MTSVTQLKPSPAGNSSGHHPRGRAVLVQPYEPEVKKGTIIIPDTVKERGAILETRAIVIEVGNSAWCDENGPRAAVGDVVLVTRLAGFQVLGHDGQYYKLVNDRDIFCVVDPKGE
jgi:co-chaperonin GroES (HSP10)